METQNDLICDLIKIQNDIIKNQKIEAEQFVRIIDVFICLLEKIS